MFAGAGTITGVETASGSGLTGGGTSGTLNLSLTNTCSANQVLQWTGSAWACAAVGTGTVTGITAGTGISVSGGAPSPTVAINTSVVPQLAAANTFTGNRTVSGNLSATGVVTGSSYQIGSNLFAFGSYANNNAFLGFAGNTAAVAKGNTGVGYQALYSNVGDTSGDGAGNTALGMGALYSNNATSGTGTNAQANSAFGYQALYSNTTGYWNTASGT